VSDYEDPVARAENMEQNLEIPSLPDVMGSDGTRDWSKSYFGLSAHPFAKDIAEVLMAPLDPMDVEMKPGKHFQYINLNFCGLIVDFRWFNLPS
jgi:hypothetical protein